MTYMCHTNLKKKNKPQNRKYVDVQLQKLDVIILAFLKQINPSPG